MIMTTIRVDPRLALEQMRRLRQNDLSLNELQACREEILHHDGLRGLLDDTHIKKFEAAEDRIALFHCLFGFWGRLLASTEFVKGLPDAEEIQSDLHSGNTRDIVRAYYFVGDQAEGRVGTSQ